MIKLYGQKKGKTRILQYGDLALISNGSNRLSKNVDWGYSSTLQERKNFAKWILSIASDANHLSDQYLTAFANGRILRLDDTFCLTEEDLRAEIAAVSAYTGRPIFLGVDLDFSGFLGECTPC